MTDIIIKDHKLDVNPEDYISNQLPELLAAGVDYLMIYGERSNGKTYGALLLALEEYFSKGYEFAYLRRWGEDLRGSNGKAVFSSLVDNKEIERLSGGKWTDVYYYSKCWYLAKWTKNKKGESVMIKDKEPFAYAFALNEYERNKSTSYPKIQTIIFDEFLARTTYIRDEFVFFMNTLSTIIRHRDGIKIIMLGNTVSMFCPYFEEFGLMNIRQMEQGKYDIYEYGDSGLKVGVYWAPDSRTNGSKKKSDKYFAFNDENSHLTMIKGGKWEFDMYPHIDWQIKPKDVVFRGFIVYCEYIVQINVCIHDGKNYVFCHWKTTPIKDEDKDVIFSTVPDPRPNWRKGFGSDKIGRALGRYFSSGKVFYQSNLVGEVVTNYLAEK